MARPKFAGKPRKPLEGVLVPAKKDAPLIRQALAGNPELDAYATLTATHILQTWSALASVRISSMQEVRRDCCRYCHGIDHAYQWVSEVEWAEAYSSALEKGNTQPPDNAGGFGYHPDARPNPECPRCHGRGVTAVLIKDSRDWTPAEQLLFDGIKYTKDGPELKFRDRSKIEEMAAKHLGMFKEQVEHTGAGGAPIQFTLSKDEANL